MEESEGNTEKLRAVFDLCDENKEGYISVEHFVDLAKEYFGADGGEDEAVTGIIQVLDPNGTKRIHFSEFCQGVQQILELKGSTSPQTPDVDLQAPNLSGITQNVVPVEEDANSSEAHDISEVSTYNEYDVMTDDDNVTLYNNDLVMSGSCSSDVADQCAFVSHPSIINDDDHDSAFSSKSEQERRKEQDITDDEEKYEDFGVSENEVTSAHELTSPTLQNPGKRITPSLLASQLYKSGSSAGTSRRSSASDEIFDDIDGNFYELNGKVKILEKQITLLSEIQVKNDVKQSRFKDENSFLSERVHILEEQLKEVECKSNEKIKTEQKKHRDFMAKTDHEKTREIEILAQSLQHIENDYQSLKEECPRLRIEVERLRRERYVLNEKLTENEVTLISLQDKYTELQEKSQSQKSAAKQEEEIQIQLLDELTKELEELRTYKMIQEKKMSPTTEPNSRIYEMEQQLIKLKHKNVNLKEENEELQAQLLNKHVEEGHDLVHKHDNSLASEMGDLPKDDLIACIVELNDGNRKLREYVDHIITRIIEQHPSLLEVQEIKQTAKGKKKS